MNSKFKKIKTIIVTVILFFKIIFYYLFKNQMHNFRHAIIEFIILITKSKKKYFYNSNFINKKVIRNNSNINDLAILLPTQLKYWDQSKDLIFSLAKEHHVFIFTDPEYINITKNISNKNIHIFLSNDKKYLNKKKYITHKNLNQWFKLHCLIQEVFDFEKKNGLFFKSFLKIRTDYGFLNQQLLKNIDRELNEDCLFTKSDLLFSGRREFFLPLGNFFEVASQVYKNFNNRFMPICTTQIINSDFDSYRFHWFQFPSEIISPINHKIALNAFDVKKLIKKKQSEILQFNKNINYKKLTKAYGEDFFSSEQLFARYLNMNNVTCKSNDKFAGSLLRK